MTRIWVMRVWAVHGPTLLLVCAWANSPLPQVPVYLGAPEAAELLPPGSFIDASRFKTGAELG